MSRAAGPRQCDLRQADQQVRRPWVGAGSCPWSVCLSGPFNADSPGMIDLNVVLPFSIAMGRVLAHDHCVDINHNIDGTDADVIGGLP